MANYRTALADPALATSQSLVLTDVSGKSGITFGAGALTTTTTIPSADTAISNRSGIAFGTKPLDAQNDDQRGAKNAGRLLIAGEDLAEYSPTATHDDLTHGMVSAESYVRGRHLTGQARKEIEEDARYANRYAQAPKPIADEEEEEEKKDGKLNRELLALAESDDAASKPADTPPYTHLHRSLIRIGTATALYRGWRTFRNRLREEPKPGKLRGEEKIRLAYEKSGQGFGEAVKREELAAGAGKARRLGTELEAGTQGLRDAAVVVRAVGSGAKTFWEGSRLLRIGGAVAAGAGVTALGVVASPLIAAALVGTVALGIGTYYKGSVIQGTKAAIKWGGEALVPTSAREEFSKGNYLAAADETLGISAFWHMTKTIGGAIKDGAVAVWNDPQKAAQNVAAAAVTAEKYGAMSVSALYNSKVRNAAGNVIGAAVTGEDTTANLLTLGNTMSADETIMTGLSTVQPNIYGALKSMNATAEPTEPVIASSGGSDTRRPKNTVKPGWAGLPTEPAPI